MLVFIPKKGTKKYTLFVRSGPQRRCPDKNGMFIKANGVCFLFYTYVDFSEARNKLIRTRRAYVVEDHREGNVCQPVELPGLKETVDLIYTACGSKVDGLKNLAYNIEKLCGKKAYAFEEAYWIRMTALVDVKGTRGSAARYFNVMMLNQIMTEG